MSYSKKDVYLQVVNICKELNLPIPSKATTIGRLGELYYYQYLVRNKKEFKALCLQPGYSFCDFIVDGKRIEVKASKKGKNGIFSFIFYKNIGKFDELVCILLEDIYTPIFIIIDKKKLENKISIAGKRKYFNRYIQ